MKSKISYFFLEACSENNYREVVRLYETYIEINHELSKKLDNIEKSILEDNIQLLLEAFKEVSDKKIMIWLYNTLVKYFLKLEGIILISQRDIYSFWLKSFKNATLKGDLEVVKWLWYKSLNEIFGYQFNKQNKIQNKIEKQQDKSELGLSKALLVDDNYISFRNACFKGHLEVAEFIYDTGFHYGWHIDLHCADNWCFYWACLSGKLEMAKWLYNKAKQISEPYNNIIEIYEAIEEKNIDHQEEKDSVYKWLSQLSELEGIATEWVLINIINF